MSNPTTAVAVITVVSSCNKHLNKEKRQKACSLKKHLNLFKCATLKLIINNLKFVNVLVNVIGT